MYSCEQLYAAQKSSNPCRRGPRRELVPARTVEVPLSDIPGAVSRVPEHLRDRRDARGELHFVARHAVRPGILSTEEARAARPADGSGSVGVLEPRPVAPESIEVLRPDVVVPRTAHRVGTVLVGEDEEDVWSVVCHERSTSRADPHKSTVANMVLEVVIPLLDTDSMDRRRLLEYSRYDSGHPSGRAGHLASKHGSTPAEPPSMESDTGDNETSLTDDGIEAVVEAVGWDSVDIPVRVTSLKRAFRHAWVRLLPVSLQED